MILRPQPLNRSGFAPYGDVIETDGADHFPINGGTIERYHDLAQVDPGVDGRVLVSIVQCRRIASLPYRVSVMERHGLGSQAFIPIARATMIVVVARPGEFIEPNLLEAFVSNGRQGVNYKAGVWHMPLIAFELAQEFLVVDRGGAGNNCEEYRFDDIEITVVDDAPDPNGQNAF